ncbi:riboflavin biosynthesis protein RibT [Fructilactobacillus frigidiflavus]|uniref:riboflavin biosynthesis protein RibT n=1 Tax=Fructilactobacillus frigidiflavus TaxID=3242688 RepID=UPI00375786D5
MLYRYQKDYEKIVLGILSLSQDRSNLEYLKQEVDWYCTTENRNLFIWKDQFNNWAGVIGIEEKQGFILLRRITLTPDVNTMFNIFHVLDNLQKIYPDKQIIGTLTNKNIITKWERNNEQR